MKKMKTKKIHQHKSKDNDLSKKSSAKLKSKLSEKSMLIKSKTIVNLQQSLTENPWCAHGPTILFERVRTEKVDNKSLKYYACSAYRDHKECTAYFQANDDANCNVAKEKMYKWKRVLKLDSNISRPSISKEPKYFCRDCGELINTDLIPHKNHNLISSKECELFLPTLNGLLISKHSSTKEAQYHFSNDTLEVLVNQFILKDRKIRIVCVGTPRIHEKIIATKLKKRTKSVESILLDIDLRLRPIYDSCSSTWGTFCHYNMFNHFFFRETEQQDYFNFLKGDEDVIIVTDPPFGGKCELIGRTLNAIKEDISKQRGIETRINIMWIFPYYMERQILQAIPEMKMSDYQVCYETKDKNGYKDGLESGNSGCRKVCSYSLSDS